MTGRYVAASRAGYFTAREMAVLRAVAEGRSDAQIARALGVSVDGVKSVNRRIYEKLGVQSRQHAVHVAYELGVLRPGMCDCRRRTLYARLAAAARRG